jgi:hypothetical protein
MPLKRTRDAGGFRQGVRRLGPAILELLRGCAASRCGEHVLISAPTGSGKTLAAFLYGIDRLASPQRDGLTATSVATGELFNALAHLWGHVRRDRGRGAGGWRLDGIAVGAPRPEGAGR